MFFSSMLSGASAMAEAPPAAENASVVVPDLSYQPTKRDLEDFGEYFYFHKVDVSFETALADIKECARYSSALTPFGKIPEFVPLGGAPNPDIKTDYNERVFWNSWAMWGMAGSIIVGVITDNQAHSVERGNTRRCMNYLGYQRYGTSRRIWKQITNGSPDEVNARFALIASGSQPKDKPLEP